MMISKPLRERDITQAQVKTMEQTILFGLDKSLPPVIFELRVAQMCVAVPHHQWRHVQKLTRWRQKTEAQKGSCLGPTQGKTTTVRMPGTRRQRKKRTMYDSFDSSLCVNFMCALFLFLESLTLSLLLLRYSCVVSCQALEVIQPKPRQEPASRQVNHFWIPLIRSLPYDSGGFSAMMSLL